MAVDGKVVYEVDYDVDKAGKNLKTLKTDIKSVGETAGKVGSTMTKNITMPLVALGGAALTGFMAISSSLDEVAKSAAGVGAGVEGLQAWQFAGKKAGIEADKMTDTFKKVQEIASGNAVAFWELGIMTQDINGDMRDSDVIMSDLVKALDGMTTAERNATLLSMGFTEELVTMNKLMEDTEGLAGNLETGLEGAVSEESIDKFEEFNDTVEDLKLQLLPIGIQIAEELLPHLQTFADWLGDEGIEKVGDFVDELIDFIEQNWLLIAALAALGPALSIFSNLVVFGTNIAGLVTKLKSLTSAVTGAKIAAGGSAATTGGAAATGGATVASGGLTTAGALGGAFGIGLGVYAVDKAMMTLKDAMPENFKSDIGTKATDIYYGMDSAAYADVSGYGSNINISKVEVNTTSPLAPNEQGQIVDDIMKGVTDQLTLRQVQGL